MADVSLDFLGRQMQAIQTELREIKIGIQLERGGDSTTTSTSWAASLAKSKRQPSCALAHSKRCSMSALHILMSVLLE